MTKRLIEVRSYKLKPGAAATFHAAAVSSAVPLLREWGTDVVAFGPSAHEPDWHWAAMVQLWPAGSLATHCEPWQ